MVYWDTGIKGYTYTGIQAYWDTRINGYRETGIQLKHHEQEQQHKPVLPEFTWSCIYPLIDTMYIISQISHTLNNSSVHNISYLVHPE